MQKTVVFSFVLPLLIIPLVVQAQGLIPCGGTGQPACNFCHIFALINNIITFLLVPDASLNNNIPLVPVLAGLLIAIGGFYLFAAAGNPQFLGRARTIFFAVGIGIIIVYGSWVFVQLFLNSIGATVWNGPGQGWWKVDCTIPLPPPPPPFTAFISSTTHFGDFGGTAVADTQCNNLAAAASLPGSWIAWVSNGPGDTPGGRGLSSVTQPWFLADGTTKIADNWADLTDGTIQNSINQTQTGALVGTPSVWTGTDEFGNGTPGTCSAWSSTAVTGTCGSVGPLGPQWSNTGSFCACSTNRRIYCFQSGP